MEWLTSIRSAVDYMEDHLKDNISAQDVADHVYLSPFFLQRGFSLMTGYGIGEYGVCIDDAGSDKFRYLIAGRYAGGPVPSGMTVYEFPGGDWAVFNCTGPVPEAFQALNTKIFRERLPNNPDYELSGNVSVEWYDCVNGEKTDADYHSAIWIPVRNKN